MLKIHTIDDAHRSRGDEIARDDANGRACHGRIRQALAECRFDFITQLPGGLLRAVQRHAVGDANAVRVFRLVTFGFELLIYLWAKAVHQHHFHAHALDHGQVLHQARQFPCLYSLTCNSNYKSFASVHVYVRCNRAEPGDKSEIENCGHVFESLRLEQNQLVRRQQAGEVAIECAECLTRLHDGCRNPSIADQIAPDLLCQTQFSQI